MLGKAQIHRYLLERQIRIGLNEPFSLRYNKVLDPFFRQHTVGRRPDNAAQVFGMIIHLLGVESEVFVLTVIGHDEVAELSKDSGLRIFRKKFVLLTAVVIDVFVAHRQLGEQDMFAVVEILVGMLGDHRQQVHHRQQATANSHKLIKDGQLVIIRNGETFSATGQKL